MQELKKTCILYRLRKSSIHTDQSKKTEKQEKIIAGRLRFNGEPLGLCIRGRMKKRDKTETHKRFVILGNKYFSNSRSSFLSKFVHLHGIIISVLNGKCNVAESGDLASHQVNDYRTTSAEELEKWAQERGFPEGTGLVAYELMMAGADSLPTLALAGGGKAAQLFGKALDALATGNEDLYQKKQAGQLGTTAGLTSAGNLLLDWVWQPDSKAGKVFKIAIPYAMDDMVGQEHSVLQQQYKQLIAQGYSESEAYFEILKMITMDEGMEYGVGKLKDYVMEGK